MNTTKKRSKRVEREDVTRSEKRKVKKGIYFISAIELGSPAYNPFLRAIETFCKKEKAQLVLLPMKSHRSPKEDLPFDQKIVKTHGHCIYTELELNNSIAIVELELNSQQINPLTGTGRLSRDMRSLIIGHSKQHLEVLPTGNSKTPRIHCTTGALTIPNYKNNRIGKIAKADHIVGGLILEVSQNRFHIFEVQCEKDGSFCYMDRRYHRDGAVTTEDAEALILGDWHAGYTDPLAEKASFEMARKLRPRKIFFHDFFDTASVNHHIMNNISAKLNLFDHINTLEKELAFARKKLQEWHAKKPKGSQLYMVASNHPEHLHQYLDGGRYVNDIVNYKKAVELAHQYHGYGIDPVQYALDPDKALAIWLGRRSDLRIEGCAVSNHGDKGIGGSRGSAHASEAVYGNAVIGHAHRPSVKHLCFTVGTNSLLDLPYNYGPRTWVHGNAVIYKGGQKSLLLIVDGKWYI